MNIYEKRAKYKVTEINFGLINDDEGSNKDVLEVQREFLKHLIVDRIYPNAVQLYKEDNDFGLIFWYDQNELCIELGLCTELISDVICNNVSVHLAIYKELDTLLEGN